MDLLYFKNSKILILSLIVILILLIITTPQIKEELNLNLNQMENENQTKLNTKLENLNTAVLAGGCFWCIEASLEQVNGIIEVKSGYTGGHINNPTYSQVTSGKTGHYEAVQVTFDKTKIDYKNVLIEFFKLFDPTDDTGQFVDKGSQYKSAIFYKNQNEKKIAYSLIQELTASKIYDKPIVTSLIENQTFYIAEEYHQDFYKKSTLRYKSYEKFSGRKEYFEEIENKKSELNITQIK